MCLKSTSTSYQSCITNNYIPVIILVMPTAYSSAEVYLHLPLSFRNKPSTAPVLLHPQTVHCFPDFFPISVAFMAVVTHCELITADQTRTNTTITRPPVSMRSNDNCCSTLHEESISAKCVTSLQMTFKASFGAESFDLKARFQCDSSLWQLILFGQMVIYTNVHGCCQ